MLCIFQTIDIFNQTFLKYFFANKKPCGRLSTSGLCYHLIKHQTIYKISKCQAKLKMSQKKRKHELHFAKSKFAFRVQFCYH